MKNGWQEEHTSNLISSFVDFVTNSFPHAHVTLHSIYSGWIPCFIVFTFLKKSISIEVTLLKYSYSMLAQEIWKGKPFFDRMWLTCDNVTI